MALFISAPRQNSLNQSFAFFFQLQNIGAYFVEATQGFVAVEVFVEADFITNLGGIEVYPGFRYVGFHLSQEIPVNRVVEGYVLRIAQIRFRFVFDELTRCLGRVIAIVGQLSFSAVQVGQQVSQLSTF